jgi:hypothetical protein
MEGISSYQLTICMSCRVLSRLLALSVPPLFLFFFCCFVFFVVFSSVVVTFSSSCLRWSREAVLGVVVVLSSLCLSHTRRDESPSAEMC